jgi:hypothetical protein
MRQAIRRGRSSLAVNGSAPETSAGDAGSPVRPQHRGQGGRGRLIDELSLSLAPLIVDRLLAEVRRAATDDGTSVLLVEQQPATALRVADRAYVIAGGEVKLTGPAAELPGRRGEIEALYLAS